MTTSAASRLEIEMNNKTEQTTADELSSQTPYMRAQAIAEMLHETPPLSQTHHALVQALGEELAELDSLRAMTCGLGDELAELDTLRAQLAEAQRDAEVNKQINRACMELPDDFRIAIELERNSGCVYLLQEDEDIGFDDPCDGIARSISAAIDAANGENHE